MDLRKYGFGNEGNENALGKFLGDFPMPHRKIPPAVQAEKAIPTKMGTGIDIPRYFRRISFDPFLSFGGI
jgi:hypothetical protein